MGSLHVSVQGYASTVGLGARIASIRSPSGVDSPMPCEGRRVAEGLGTDFADVRPLSSVYPEMHSKSRTLNEGFAAHAVGALAEVRKVYLRRCKHAAVVSLSSKDRTYNGLSCE